MLESSNSRSIEVFFPQLNIPSLHFVHCAHSLETLYKFNHTCKFKDVKKSYTSKTINYNLILNLNLHFLSLLDRREKNIKTNFMLSANKIHQHTVETGGLCVLIETDSKALAESSRRKGGDTKKLSMIQS